MSDCSREAWQAPRGIDGAVHWQGGTESELHYARFVNGEERKADYVELDGERFERVRECEPRIEPWECNPTMFDAYCGNCGYEIGDELMRLPNYCEECGARVKEAN